MILQRIKETVGRSVRFVGLNDCGGSGCTEEWNYSNKLATRRLMGCRLE